jgi:predicted outer membrane repeat protein
MRTARSRVSPRKLLPSLSALILGLVILGTASESHATLYVGPGQANTKINDNDGQCSLYEAIDAINKGVTAPGAQLHGCQQDEWGGPNIELVGDGTHYKTFGAVITSYMQLYAYAPYNHAILEHSGPSAVLTNKAGDEVNHVWISGFTIQHTGTGPGRVIKNEGFLELNGNTIQGGNVSSNSGEEAYGGGIYNYNGADPENSGEVYVFACSINNNKAKRGGGIYTATVRGVGIDLSSVTNNTATEVGGGMYTSGRLNVQNVTVSDNTAGGNGGGTYCNHGPNSYCSFSFSTIANNRAARGGGIYRVSDTATCNTGSINCNNTEMSANIFWRNKTTGGSADDFFGDPHTDGASPSDRSLFTSFNGTTNHAVDDPAADALLGGLGFNFGNITRSRPIPSNSPAKDTAQAGCPDQDQNFNFRPMGPACDMGAYELAQ